jgi:hypothetical protein
MTSKFFSFVIKSIQVGIWCVSSIRISEKIFMLSRCLSSQRSLNCVVVVDQNVRALDYPDSSIEIFKCIFKVWYYAKILKCAGLGLSRFKYRQLQMHFKIWYYAKILKVCFDL